MGVNKVVLGGNTLMDITSTTATVSDVSTGKYFYDIDGNRVEGTGTIASEYPIGGSLASGTCTGYYIPSTITVINKYAFRDQANLATINLENIETIQESAFYNCTSLDNIDLSSVTYVGGSAFYGCTALTTVNIPNSCNLYYDESNSTYVGGSAFYGCTALTTVNIPNAEDIPTRTFQGCTRLTSVNVIGATSIGTTAFYKCSVLTSVDVSNATSIGAGAFQDCSALTNISVKNGVKISPNSSLTKIATVDGYMFTQAGTSSNKIYMDGELIGTLNSSTLTFTFGIYTFTRTSSSTDFTMSWTE